MTDPWQPNVVVELDLDWITNDPGATNSDGDPCYLTPYTTPGYADEDVGAKTYYYQSATSKPMAGLAAIPCVLSVDIDDDKLQLGLGQGSFGKCTIRMMDFPDDDRTEDPYFDDRDPAPVVASYWRRKIRRVRYFDGRTVRVRWGNRSDTYDVADYVTRTYQIERVSGPDTNGIVTIDCVSRFGTLSLNETKVPVPSEMTIAADISDVATSATLLDFASAAASGVARIDDELVAYTQTGGVVSITQRGAYGSEASAHSAGSTWQECIVLDGMQIDEVLEAILNAAGIEDSDLDLVGWASERAAWLGDYTVESGVLSEPRKATDWINGIGESFNVYLWDDPEAGLIRMRALHPEITPTQTIYGYDIIGKASEEIDDRDRRSSTDVRVGLHSQVSDDSDQTNYSLHILGATLGIGVGKHRFEKVELILSRWHTVGQSSQARAAAQAATDHLQDGRITYKIEVPASVGNSLKLGTVVDLDQTSFLDTQGIQESRRAMVVAREAVGPGRSWKLVLEASAYERLRYAVFMPDDADDYADTSDENRFVAGFFSDDDGLVDGDPPYVFA